MGTDAFPDVNALALWIPNPALGVQSPIDVQLPDASGIADQAGHSGRGNRGRR